MPRVERAPAAILFEADLGDGELVVREHPDGQFTIDLNDARTVINVERMQEIVGGFMQIGRIKGWT